MFKILAFSKRKPGMSPDDFRVYYETRHAALVAEVAPSAQCYRRNYLQLEEAANINAGDLDFDVVTEIEFADRAEFERWFEAMSEPKARERVGADLANFTDPDKFRVCVVAVGQ
jgi:uncharacterized protein (TIGR02118 family)